MQRHYIERNLRDSVIKKQQFQFQVISKMKKIQFFSTTQLSSMIEV